MYCKSRKQEFKQLQILFIYQNIQTQSGGGSYDEAGNQKKIGKWVELDEEFNYNKQVTYNGKYKRNGLKVDRQDTSFMCQYSKNFVQMQILQKKNIQWWGMDHMIKKEMRKRLDDGQIWITSFILQKDSFIMVNLIRTVCKQ
ncbi:unnamed protein product [Paramecium sonneborni]|uniref:Uncharacterized protein n=1 Tax=Paramecium sonneborni TaxID=65129 RepID=A0A8S1RT62_9CILI|nr:unnamed protein product [Paramecium sonneborni]